MNDAIEVANALHFRGRDAPLPAVPGLRLAVCGEYDELRDRPCPGYLVFAPGDQQAACSQCQGWCGSGVADYLAMLELDGYSPRFPLTASS